jgi:hypothetical protein
VAGALVLKDGVRATIVHAYRPPDDARTVLRTLLMDVSNDSSRYDLVVENATPAAAIEKIVRRLKPDLLVLGTRGHSRLGQALLGSVANRVMATAPCDVLVVSAGSGSITPRRLAAHPSSALRRTAAAAEPSAGYLRCRSSPLRPQHRFSPACRCPP